MQKLAVLLLLASSSTHAFDLGCPVGDLDCIDPPDQGEIERLEQRVEELEAQQAQDQQGTKTLSVMDNQGNLRDCIYWEAINELECN
jgi:hypothetical protein